MAKSKTPRSTASTRSTKARKPASRKAATPPDPTSDAALLALPASYAAPPDIPVAIAIRELLSLARLARACADRLAPLGIDADAIDRAARFARALGRTQKAWEAARAEVALAASERKLLTEAEALDAKLLAGGRWALRRDATAQAELSRISEGSGLLDTLQDLRDLLALWERHAEHRAHTRITAKDLARAAVLIEKLEGAAHREADDVAAARALMLRNRAFWAGHELAQEIREGGRYAFGDEPTLAAKFVSRYRSANRRRAKARRRQTPSAPATETETAASA